MVAEFGFEVVHRPGKSNVVADALSRLSAVDYGVASRGISREDLFKGLEQAYQKDKETKMIMESLDVVHCVWVPLTSTTMAAFATYGSVVGIGL